MFRLAERVEPFRAQFAADTGMAHAAKGRCVVVRQRFVDPEAAGLDVLHRPHRQLEVTGENRGAEAKFGIVGFGDRLVGVLDDEDRDHRAEKLFGGGDAAVLDAGDDGRLEEMALEAVGLEAFAAGEQRGAFLEHGGELLLDLVDRVTRNQRTHVGRLLHRIADLERLDLLDHALDEILRDAFDHVDALGRGADLTGV